MWIGLQCKIQVRGLEKAKASNQSQAGKVRGKILGKIPDKESSRARKNSSMEQAYEAEIKPTRRTQ